MDKQAYKDSVNHQEESEIARVKAISDNVARKIESNRITKPESQYRLFEVEFGANKLNEMNNFILSLDKSPNYIKDPLLLLCNKFLSWHIEVGSDRLFHEFNVRYDGGQYADNNEGSAYVIKKAWEQVEKEQEIIDISRQRHKAWLLQQTDDDPNLPAKDIQKWLSMCNSFSEVEALAEFEYPLSFNIVFGDYKSRQFYYGKKEHDNKYLEKSE